MTREETKIRNALDLLVSAGFLIEGKLDAGKIRANYFGAEVALRQLHTAIQATNNALGHLTVRERAASVAAQPDATHPKP